MNILPLKFNTNMSFKSYQDDGIIGYDDSVSQDTRKFLRAHYDSWHLPYNSIYETEHRMSNYQMRQLTRSLRMYNPMQKVDDELNIYRGQTLVERPYSLFDIKNKGVKTVIDLVGYGKTYEEEAKRVGLEYFSYNIFDNWWNTVEFEDKHLFALIKFIQKMQEGNIYIGCQHGSNDTDIALLLNEFFNPKLSGKIKTKIPADDSDFPVKLNTIYDMFTKAQKKELGWTKEFEQKLIKKLISI